jgi:hypothetical protein
MYLLLYTIPIQIFCGITLYIHGAYFSQVKKPALPLVSAKKLREGHGLRAAAGYKIKMDFADSMHINIPLLRKKVKNYFNYFQST